jgi:hypothetical protein
VLGLAIAGRAAIAQRGGQLECVREARAVARQPAPLLDRDGPLLAGFRQRGQLLARREVAPVQPDRCGQQVDRALLIVLGFGNQRLAIQRLWAPAVGGDGFLEPWRRGGGAIGQQQRLAIQHGRLDIVRLGIDEPLQVLLALPQGRPVAHEPAPEHPQPTRWLDALHTRGLDLDGGLPKQLLA